jgi:hypothetical protein
VTEGGIRERAQDEQNEQNGEELDQREPARTQGRAKQEESGAWRAENDGGRREAEPGGVRRSRGSCGRGARCSPPLDPPRGAADQTVVSSSSGAAVRTESRPTGFFRPLE